MKFWFFWTLFTSEMTPLNEWNESLLSCSPRQFPSELCHSFLHKSNFSFQKWLLKTLSSLYYEMKIGRSPCGETFSKKVKLKVHCAFTQDRWEYIGKTSGLKLHKEHWLSVRIIKMRKVLKYNAGHWLCCPLLKLWNVPESILTPVEPRHNFQVSFVFAFIYPIIFCD